MSWLCTCGLINSGLNQKCAAALTETSREHNQCSSNSPSFVEVAAISRELRLESYKMTEQEELFAKFYSGEKVLVKDIDNQKLRERRDELAKIAFEAKARLTAVDDEGRERHSRNKVKEWTITPDSSALTSEAINVVKTRKDRMTKLERMREDLKKYITDEATLNEMMAKMEKTATEKNVNTITFRSNKVKVQPEVKKVEVPISKEPSKPFDPSSLKFGS